MSPCLSVVMLVVVAHSVLHIPGTADILLAYRTATLAAKCPGADNTPTMTFNVLLFWGCVNLVRLLYVVERAMVHRRMMR